MQYLQPSKALCSCSEMKEDLLGEIYYVEYTVTYFNAISIVKHYRRKADFHMGNITRRFVKEPNDRLVLSEVAALLELNFPLTFFLPLYGGE